MEKTETANRQKLTVWWGKGTPEGKAKSVLSSELAETPSYHQQNWTQMISLLWFI